MTTDTDKLVEMAASLDIFVSNDREQRVAMTPEKLAAFASAHIASLCGDVEPVERLTVEEIKTLRQQVRNDPRCQDEHWFVLMARAIEDRYLAAALTDQSQKKESP